MANKIEDYVAIATELIENDQERDNLYAGIDDMWHGNWHATPDLDVRPDFREVVDLSPHDALRAGTTIMATSLPKWNVQPFNTNEGERERAEKIEYILDWHFRQMSQRGTGTILWDIVHSALRYDAIAIWLDYLPYWSRGKASSRVTRALRNGPFLPTVINPRFVHVRKDAFGENAVLHASNKSATDVANYWGSKGGENNADIAKLKADLAKRKGEDMYFNLFDMMLYDDNEELRRVVWGNMTESSTLSSNTVDHQYILMDEPVPYKFSNWIVKIGGSNMETESKYSVHPLLAPLYWTHKWKDQNIYESIVHSEIIKYARAPRILTKTSGGEGVEIDLQDGGAVNLKAGIETAEPWKPAPIDENLKELLDRGKASISSATLPRILQNPEFAGNTPFASVNAIMQTAIGSMNTAKILCENATQELGIRMLEWAYDQKDTLYAYRVTPTKKENGETVNEGQEIALTPTDYHPDHLLIKVQYNAEVPTDYMQRLNAAISAVERLDYPKTAALEDLGHSNADLLIERRTQEKYDEMTVNADLQTILGEAQLSITAKQMELQMQAQQAMQQQQGTPVPGQPVPNQIEPTGQEQNAAMAQQMMQGAYPSNSQGNAPQGVAQGQGYNENAGGISPATANPAVNNREAVTGTDITGRPI